jgi:GAF domain-containing protein
MPNTIIEGVKIKGPLGDERLLQITVTDKEIEVINTLAPEDARLIVRRPLYGYEKQLTEEIIRLRRELRRLALNFRIVSLWLIRL